MSTVVSLWLPVRDTDEAAIEAGCTPDVFRFRVPAGADTALQRDLKKLTDLNIRELHLVINSRKPYKSSYLNSLSKAVGDMYNEWADVDVDDDDEDEEDDEEEEEDGDDDEEEEDDAPPPKKAKAGPAGPALPVVKKLDAEAILKPELNLSRPNGVPTRVPAFCARPGESFITIFVTQHGDEEE
jgi:hypothetical protein